MSCLEEAGFPSDEGHATFDKSDTTLIVGASRIKIIQLLIDERLPFDELLYSTFLLTFRGFMSALEWMEVLLRRYYVNLCENVRKDPSKVEYWFAKGADDLSNRDRARHRFALFDFFDF